MKASEPKQQYQRERGLCAVYALPFSLPDRDLCQACAAKQEPDLTRARDWG